MTQSSGDTFWSNDNDNIETPNVPSQPSRPKIKPPTHSQPSPPSSIRNESLTEYNTIGNASTKSHALPDLSEHHLIPKVLGQPTYLAQENLSQAGFRSIIEEVDVEPLYAAGIDVEARPREVVLIQNPNAGTSAPKGTTVVLQHIPKQLPKQKPNKEKKDSDKKDKNGEPKADKQKKILYILVGVVVLLVGFVMLSPKSNKDSGEPENSPTPTAMTSPTPTVRPTGATTQLLRVPPFEGSGVEEEALEEQISSAGFILGEIILVYVDDAQTDDTILDQYPVAESFAPKGSAVSVVAGTSSDPGPKVPNLVGMKENKAVKQVEKAKLNTATKQKIDSDLPAGVVAAQLPKPDSRSVLDGNVVLYISNGKVVVPDLTQKTIEKAEKKLEKLGLVSSIQYKTTTNTPGIVLTQSPKEGTFVAPGSEIILFVSANETENPTPIPPAEENS